MCVCVILRSMCLKFKLRDDFKRLLCWLDHWLSCMLDCIHVCIFHSKKTGLKKWLDTSSIPPRHLAICRASQVFFYRNPDNSSIPDGSIKKAPASSIAPRHLVDQSNFCSWNWFFVARYLLDTSVVDDQFLDTYLDNFLDTSWYLICQALLMVLFKPPSRFVSHIFDLSRSVHACSSPKHSLFHPQPLPQSFFKLFQVFLHFVSF